MKSKPAWTCWTPLNPFSRHSRRIWPLFLVKYQICRIEARISTPGFAVERSLASFLCSRPLNIIPHQKIEKPLSSLISDITVSPSLAFLILDSDVGEPWISAIEGFERHLEMTRVRSRVKAARDLTEVAEGLRIVASITVITARWLAHADSRPRPSCGCSSCLSFNPSEQASQQICRSCKRLCLQSTNLYFHSSNAKHQLLLKSFKGPTLGRLGCITKLGSGGMLVALNG